MEREGGVYKGTLRPALDFLERYRILGSEEGHVVARRLLHALEEYPPLLRFFASMMRGGPRLESDRLHSEIGIGQSLENPVMVGAGWDKHGEAVMALYELGFSAVEVGAVLPRPQPGNEKPRQFMLSAGVALNRLGFNSVGVRVVKENLQYYHFMWTTSVPVKIGINLGINKETTPADAPGAYASVLRSLYAIADYFTINVSSPNTPDLRALQGKEHLVGIVQAVKAAQEFVGGVSKPTFIKIAPDLEDGAVADVIQVVLDHGLAGIVATNTTVNPEIKAKYGARWRKEVGGLSGDDSDFRRMATEKVAFIFREAGSKLSIIGAGGVKDWATAWDKLLAGANAVQVVTAVRGEGLSVATNINRGLIVQMDRLGVKKLTDVIGNAARHYR